MAPPEASGPTLHHVRFDPTEAKGAFVLTVTDGPDQGSRFRIDAGEPGRSLLGGSEACPVRLTDRTVSRRHAALEVGDGMLRVTDLGSRNGTRVNGVLVREALIEREATLEVGASRLRIERDPAAQTATLSSEQAFEHVVGASTEMRRLYPLFAKFAATSIPVVIEGETGTGKEALAEALHQAGPRSAGPFVVFDCTAIPANLLESELFGHDRGAFTGAERARQGVFEQARGGTLFIDEIGDLDLMLQPKLLRAIDRAEVKPLGGQRVVKVDARVVAATRRDLDREVQAGRFRDDLFHRLAIGRVELPPLRSRRGDIPLLARHFWQELGGEPTALPPALLRSWEDQPWPGNVRELRNTVARHLALGELAGLDATGRPTAPADLSGPGDQAFADLMELPLGDARARLVGRFERAYVRKLLERTGGNVTRAAERAGVARRYFHLLKAKLGERDA